MPLNMSTTEIPAFNKEELTFVCISDTHSLISREFIDNVPDGDVLLHAGDFTEEGELHEIYQFNNLLGYLPHPVKIVIAGNHEESFDKSRWDKFLHSVNKLDMKKYCMEEYGVEEPKHLLTNCIYLEEESLEVSGLKIYGAPWAPRFYTHGFSCERGKEIREKWDKIPTDTDILITHCPPNGQGDLVKDGTHHGCEELIKVVQDIVKPKIHLFGHLHEGYGTTTDGVTTFINAATCDEHGYPVNKPIVFKLPNPIYKPETTADNKDNIQESS